MIPAKAQETTFKLTQILPTLETAENKRTHAKKWQISSTAMRQSQWYKIRYYWGVFVDGYVSGPLRWVLFTQLANLGFFVFFQNFQLFLIVCSPDRPCTSRKFFHCHSVMNLTGGFIAKFSRRQENNEGEVCISDLAQVAAHAQDPQRDVTTTLESAKLFHRSKRVFAADRSEQNEPQTRQVGPTHFSSYFLLHSVYLKVCLLTAMWLFLNILHIASLADTWTLSCATTALAGRPVACIVGLRHMHSCLFVSLLLFLLVRNSWKTTCSEFIVQFFDLMSVSIFVCAPVVTFGYFFTAKENNVIQLEVT